MENQLQLRAELQSSILQWANVMMTQYGASAAMIEDAINSVLVKLKEQILIDTLQEHLQQHVQETENPVALEGEEDGNYYNGDASTD